MSGAHGEKKKKSNILSFHSLFCPVIYFSRKHYTALAPQHGLVLHLGNVDFRAPHSGSMGLININNIALFVILSDLDLKCDLYDVNRFGFFS